MEIPKGLYRHYKGNLYRVIGMATHSETLETLVIYQDETDASKCWARPATMWTDEITLNGRTVHRFEQIDE